MAKEVLVFAEQKNDSLTTAAKGAFGAAKELLSQGFSISAIVAGKNIDNSVKQAFSLGASKIYVAKHEQLENYRTLPFTSLLVKIITENSPEIVMFGYSTSSTDLAPRVAYSFNVASLTGVTSVTWENDKLIVGKPAYNEHLQL